MIISVIFGRSFHEQVFNRNWNSMEDWILCNSIVGYHIATSICTCHDSTAVVPGTSCHSDHFTTTWMIAEWNLHRIWITMENHLWNESLIAKCKASGSLNTSSNDNKYVCCEISRSLVSYKENVVQFKTFSSKPFLFIWYTPHSFLTRFCWSKFKGN